MQSNDTSVARSDVGIDCMEVRLAHRLAGLPPATAPIRNIGTVIQKDRIDAGADHRQHDVIADATRRMRRPPPSRAPPPFDNEVFPAMPARENSAAMTPDSQTAFSPYSSRK